jgi:hypothetical protein
MGVLEAAGLILVFMAAFGLLLGAAALIGAILNLPFALLHATEELFHVLRRFKRQRKEPPAPPPTAEEIAKSMGEDIREGKAPYLLDRPRR